jgi:thiamine pyrophosphate-dependent acetolactate synthase large subunit-like protein
LAQSLGVPARRVTDAAIVPAIKEAIARRGTSLIDVLVQDGFGE